MTPEFKGQPTISPILASRVYYRVYCLKMLLFFSSVGGAPCSVRSAKKRWPRIKRSRVTTERKDWSINEPVMFVGKTTSGSGWKYHKVKWQRHRKQCSRWYSSYRHSAVRQRSEGMKTARPRESEFTQRRVKNRAMNATLDNHLRILIPAYRIHMVTIYVMCMCYFSAGT